MRYLIASHDETTVAAFNRKASFCVGQQAGISWHAMRDELRPYIAIYSYTCTYMRMARHMMLADFSR